MIQLPDRLSQLAARLEAGDTPTVADLRRIAVLQAIDIAKAGEDFVRESGEEEARRTQEFAAL